MMMQMLIVGYCMGIRSERRLHEQVHLNLAYRWFCGLGLDGKAPDHSILLAQPAPAQESRDAARPPQACAPAQPAPTARIIRRSLCVPARRKRGEPQKAGKAPAGQRYRTDVSDNSQPRRCASKARPASRSQTALIAATVADQINGIRQCRTVL